MYRSTCRSRHSNLHGRKDPRFPPAPTEPFRAVRDGIFSDAVTCFAALLIVNAVLSAIVGLLGFRAIGMPGTGIAGAGGVRVMIAAFLFALIAGIASLVVGSVPLHIGVVVMGGRGGIIQTFKAVVYGLTPYYLLGWVPVVGGLAGIWGLIIEILGIRELHDMTTGRAAFAWLISQAISSSTSRSSSRLSVWLSLPYSASPRVRGRSPLSPSPPDPHFAGHRLAGARRGHPGAHLDCRPGNLILTVGALSCDRDSRGHAGRPNRAERP